MFSLGVTSYRSPIHHCILWTKLLCIHNHPSSVWSNYIEMYLQRQNLQARVLSADVMYFSDRTREKIKKYSRYSWQYIDITIYLTVLHKYIDEIYTRIGARSGCANLWSSRLVWLKDRDWTVEPERTVFTRRVRFPAAGAASYTASWKTQRLSLPGKTGLVKWYLHTPASFSAEEGVRRSKCPVAERRGNISGGSVKWQLYTNITPVNHLKKMAVFPGTSEKKKCQGSLFKRIGPGPAAIRWRTCLPLSSYHQSVPVSGRSLGSSQLVHVPAALESPAASPPGSCD